MRRKFASLVLAISMILAVIPSLSVAAEEEPKPKLIYNVMELNAVRDDLAGTYYLMDDIDLSTYGEWTPIGYSQAFTGYFNGMGHTISGLSITNSEYDYTGLFGEVTGTITNLGVSGNIAVTTDNAGLLAGYVTGIVTNCFSTGEVSAQCNVGGLIGYLDGNIENCYSRANVTGLTDGTSTCLGGLVGESGGGSIKRSYSTGYVRTKNDNAIYGGLLGDNYRSYTDILFCYYDRGTAKAIDTDNGFAATTAQMKTQSTFTGWDFTEVWGIDGDKNDGYPYLKFGTYEYTLEGAGSQYDPYIIRTQDDLIAVTERSMGKYGSYYELENDIKLDAVFWTPIGGNLSGYDFDGVFNGNGHTISGLNITQDNFSYSGLFGSVTGTVTNLGVSGNIAVTTDYAGLLAGYVTGTVTNCFSTGEVSAQCNVGGLIGYLDGNIENCYSRANVTGLTDGTSTCLGGLVGESGGGSIKRSYSTGYVRTKNDNAIYGGLLGDNYRSYTDILFCYYDRDTTRASDTDKGIGVSTAQAKTQSTYEDWDFSTVWAMSSDKNGGYPYLRMVNPSYEEPELPPEAPKGEIKSLNITRDGQRFSLLTTKQTFKNDSDETVYITAKVEWGDAKPGRIVIAQRADRYIEANDGNFGAVKPAKTFKPGEAIYVIAVDGSGRVTDTKKVLLQILEPTFEGNIGGEEHKFTLFDRFSFTIPDDKPVLGNQTFEIDFGSINADLELDDGSFKAVIGANFEKNDDGKFGLEEYKTFKETMKDMQKKVMAGISGTIIHNTLRQKGYGQVSHVSVKKDWTPEADISGYIEGKVENGKLIPTEGGILVSAKMSASIDGQVMVWIIPVYYTIGGGGEIRLATGVKGMVQGEGFKPMFDGNLEIAPYFELGGGIGIIDVGQVGARGNATLGINIALDHNYQKVDLTGDAFFEIKVATFSLYERNFAHGTWTIWENGQADSTSLMSAPENIYDSIKLDEPLTPERRDYADTPAEWLGEDTGASLMASDYSNKELRILQSNSYPNTEPQMMSVNGEKVMIWTTDNTSRDAVNKSMLVYSIYNDTNDTWTAPKAIMDDGTGDFYPEAKDGYVVWQKATKVFLPDVTLTELGANSEIYVAKFNGDGFDTPIRLTNNTTVDTQPHIAVDGENAIVAWTQNTENNILGYTGTNAVYQSTFDGSVWSEPVKLDGGLNTVAYLTVGYMGDEAVVAYSLDEDNDLNTINDREIYLIRDGATTRFTNNDVLDSNPIIEDINGTPALFWYSGSNVYYVTDLDDIVYNTISADGIERFTDDYSIISNGDNTAVLWTSVMNGVSEVHGALYDGSQWSNDVTITQTGQSARYPDGVIEDDGKLIIGFNRIQNVEEGDYFVDGRADLCVINVTPSYDISVEDVYIGELAPNTDVPVYFTVVNSGELPVNDISANIIGVNGESNATFDFEQTLQPGESVELEGHYTVDDTVIGGEITVKVSTETGSEYNEENNEASVAVGLSDVEVTNVADTADGDSHNIVLTVKNSGYTNAQNVKVAIFNGSESGELISEQNVGVLDAQSTMEVTFEIDANELATDNSFIALTAMVTTDSDEVSQGNNYQGFTIAKGSKSPQENPSTDYTVNSITTESGNVVVNVTGYTSISGKLIVAAYDSDGKLISAVYKDIKLNEKENTDISFDLDVNGAAHIAAFIWNDLDKMQPISNKADLEL